MSSPVRHSRAEPAPAKARGGNPVQSLITDHLDIWAAAEIPKKAGGRGRGAKTRKSPHGIKKLRELILDLAVSGKLVPQDPNDEPASVLLEKIAAEKERLVKEGEIKKQKSLPSISKSEVPFKVPKGWEWVRLGEVGFIQTGGTPSKTRIELFGTDIPFIKPGDISQGKVNYFNEGLSNLGQEILGRIAPCGSLLMVCIGTIGKCAPIDRSCAFNQQINSITPYVNLSSYLYKTVLANYFQNEAWKRSSSTTIAILNKGKWASIPIVLPPIEEQHRIVAKVDELMALCDVLEQEQTDSSQAHQTLVETLLATLTQTQQTGQPTATDGGYAEHTAAESGAAAWLRIAEHFDTLFTTEQSIDQLKKTILQLAVMGKLVPQNPNDEPASELLKKVAVEKTKLIKKGKIKKERPLPSAAEKEKPFELAESWVWVNFEDIVNITSGITKGRKLAGRKLITLPYLRVANVQRGFVDLDIMKEIDLPEDELEKFTVIERDLLITEGGDWDKVGRAAIWRNEIPLTVHQNHVFKARCILQEQNETWLEKYLNSEAARGYFAGSSKQTTNLASINKTQLRGCLVAVPPIEEQRRIVAKVDELMATCESLKVRVREAQVTQIQLANAIVEQAIT